MKAYSIYDILMTSFSG